VNTAKALTVILILLSTTSIASRIRSEPYELTENDLTSIIEIAQELGVDTSKTLRKSNSSQSSRRVFASFEIESDVFLGNAQKAARLTCNREPDSEWGCKRTSHWLLKIGDEEEVTVRAPEDFEEHSETYYEALDLAISTIGTETTQGQISFIEKDEYIFWVRYGSISGGGCFRSIKVEPSVLDLTVDWIIKNPYRSSVTCVKPNKAFKYVPPASWLHRTRAAHAPLN